MDLHHEEVESPVGIVHVVSDGTDLRAVDFEGCEERLLRLLKRHYGCCTLHATRRRTEASARLRHYFAGDLRAVDDVATATNGTPFQQRVWSALRTIPAGTTTSYGALAARLGRPTASRAVGLANGSNPIGIVIPCHRVIGADGTLTGYGGGLKRKHWLLRHEGVEIAGVSNVNPTGTLVRGRPAER